MGVHQAMPDAPFVFEHRHPVEGWLRLAKRDAVIEVECRWPFDLDADDWIFIGNRVSLDDYRACLDDLAATNQGHARGIDGGFIAFMAVDAAKTQLEMCDFASHAPTRLSVMLPEGASSLARRLRDALERGDAS